MALIDEFTASQDSIFIKRCEVAAVAFAINIIKSEAADVNNHKNRSVYATALVRTPEAFGPQLALGVIALLAASDPNVVTDTQINNAVATIWDIYAGTL